MMTMNDLASGSAPPLPAPDTDARGWALFLDVDGTLLELASHPDAVVVPPALRDLLPRLQSALGGALALVSGRRLADLDRIFAPLTFDAAGAHGAEWRRAGDVSRRPTDAAAIAVIADRLRQVARDWPGSMVEEKGFSVAFHYRNAELAEADARRLVQGVVPPGETSYRLMAGKKVVEIVAHAVGKGEAICHLLSRPPFAGRRPVFAGDDVTDEDGFRAVNALDGYTIHVGEGMETAARWRVPDVGTLRSWLAGPVLSGLTRRSATPTPQSGGQQRGNTAR